MPLPARVKRKPNVPARASACTECGDPAVFVVHIDGDRFPNQPRCAVHSTGPGVLRKPVPRSRRP